MRIFRYLSFCAIGGLALAAAPAQADQIEQLFKDSGKGCVDTVKINLVEAIRAGIDKEVKRHEAALQKPPSLDSLGCLDNLMKVNLDFAIQVPDLSQIFNQALSNAEQQICSYAQEQWNKVTEPLQSALQLPSFDSLQLPGGMGGGSVPTLNYNYKGGSLNLNSPSTENSGRRENDGSLLNNLYNDLYGPGGL
ncbi:MULTISPECIES: hypothetical protein [Hyphomicrobiales]|uniref:hypothetical protein n=1 Tax=Hyphomicrobiales TaxID=356 RepID=UPI000DC01630|nr:MULTISPECIES: hypothetical protein [Hyphomicrobiales]RAL97901.1 hypothetical protein DOU54_09855 [Agrobacterium sp. MS2]UZD72192.1 hypothetical protein LJ361_23055 [Brucella sp. JSBI001]